MNIKKATNLGRFFEHYATDSGARHKLSKS